MQIQGGICIIFIMACVSNLHKDQGATLDLFIMAEVGNLLEKITDPLVIIIRVVRLMAGYF